MTTYTAVCTRAGDWWAITVAELPGVFSQARRLDQVAAMAHDAIVAFLNVAPDDVAVEVQPELPAVVRAARKARAKQAEAEKSAEQVTLAAARELLEKGYTVRDAGCLLGISPQRVSQLTTGAKKTSKAQQDGKAATKSTHQAAA